ncbi:uncharacterized protein LOC112187701 [Rosa chinensis]|uniref:uncharacterized protein LOC112187701 n=1 Tax=Rosa chinensis TaxID=74649 RepID=UPI000D08A53B|nr:uncharacterized protein LOC112187701 [Rosa chinensis]
MKVPTPVGIATIRVDQAAARQCYSLTLSRGKGKSEMLPVVSNLLTDKYEDPRDDTDSDQERPGAVEYVEEVVLSEEFPDRIVKICTKLASAVRENLISFLRSNASAFARSYEDMPGIPTDMAMHNLSIVPFSALVRQKRGAFTHEKYRAIQVEVKKLMAINFVKEVTYPRWLANVVMVPKKTPGSWYNQIWMNPADEEHTAFTTDKGLYCYQVMPFGLKNAGATYQRLVNSMFVDVIGTIMEVYVDDMLVKSLTAEDHVTNVSIVFSIILRNGMRLNPQKCIFGVEVGRFLGYIISHRGIEANPEKVQAILDMISPTYRNDVESITGKVAALSRFISRLTDKCTPIFKLLKTQHVEVISWSAEHEAAFLSLKAYLAAVPLLYKPVPREMLYVYLAASSTAVLQKPETSGRLIKWAIELGEFDIKYQPRTAIKGQAAADFISKLIPSHDPPLGSPEPPAPDPPLPSTWRLHVDGASNKKTSGAGILLISPDDQVYEYALKFAFKASNNVAEYEALVAGLQIALELGVQHLRIFSDSQLVMNQVSGNFEAKESHMSSYQALARALVQRLASYVITQIPRAKNDKADALAKIAATSPSPAYKATKVEILEKPSSSKMVSEIFTVDHTASWMDPILKYMVDGLDPDDKVEARRL